MSSPFITPEASFSEQSHSAMQSQLGGLSGLAGGNVSPEAKAKKLREACEGFESIFIQKMWQEMRNAVPKTGMLTGREERFWQDMYDQELAKSMTKAGGIGLADMMYEQLSASLGDASKSAAGRGMTSGFAPEAAPLLPAREAASDAILGEPEAQEAPADLSIYEGDAPESAPAAGVAEAAMGAPAQPLQTAPYEAPAAMASDEREPRRHPGKIKKAGTQGDSPLDLAYLARREAGDKLGSRAVRPALQPKTKKARVEAEAPEPLTAASAAQAAQTPAAPGSEASLRSAVEAARAGVVEPSGGSRSMTDLLASVKLENARLAAAQATAAQPEAEATEAAPEVRKVTYSTNIPRNAKGKKNSDAIRLLNADNTSVNSKAGKGLAAYHAAQEQAKSAAPQPVAPLSVADAARQPTFTIPVLGDTLE